MTRTINGIDELKSLVGEHLGYSSYVEITQEQVDQFAEATGDHQWIHVDVERAKAGPFGGPIAHGYLTLSLIAGRFFEVLELQGFAMVINYGANKVRFPSPLKEGDRYRLSMDLGDVTEKAKGWHEALFKCAIQIEGSDKPACVAECVYRFLPAR